MVMVMVAITMIAVAVANAITITINIVATQATDIAVFIINPSLLRQSSAASSTAQYCPDTNSVQLAECAEASEMNRKGHATGPEAAAAGGAG